MKLSPKLEEQVKEEIWAEINKRLGKTDIDINAKKITVTGATVTVDFFLDLDTES